MAVKKAPRKIVAVEDCLTREIRQAIADDGRSCYALALASGVDEGTVRKFVSRESLVRIDSAGKLAAVLGLHLIRKAKPKVAKKQESQVIADTFAPDVV